MTENQFNWENVWQVACGDDARDYRDMFLDYGLIAVGAEGDRGPYHVELRPYDKKLYDEDDSVGKIRPVAAGMREGDTIILKKGKSLVAVGIIAGNYRYDGYPDWQERWSDKLRASEANIGIEETRLDDVDGWDLRHTRPVNWWVGDEIACEELTRSTANKVNSSAVIAAAKRFITTAKKHDLVRSLPQPAEVLDNEDIIATLMANGLSSARSEELARRLQQLQRLARWYQKESSYVSEHEIRAYLVWPLLQVLGWSEQCVKFEFEKRDIVIYQKPVTVAHKGQTPFLLGESKKLFSGLANAMKQVRQYAAESKAKALLGTDGVRYLLEYANDGKTTSAYLNLLKLRNRHPFDECIEGAPTVLAQLLRP